MLKLKRFFHLLDVSKSYFITSDLEQKKDKTVLNSLKLGKINSLFFGF
jgi:hypothetical protein